MKKLFYLFLAGIIITSSSCESDPDPDITTSMELNFKATYGDDTFLTFQEFTYPDGRKIQFNEFNFFVSDIVLTSSGVDGSNTTLVDIDKIDLAYTADEQALAEQGQTLIVRDIPVGDYSGIQIGYGVNADLNRTKPTDYGSGHPLRDNYWDGWSSYIFSILEGGADMNGDGSIVMGGSESESFTYHSGTDQVFVEGFISRPITLEVDKVTKLEMTIDVQKLFKNNNPTYDTNGDGYLDIELFTGTHSDEQLEIARQIMSNFQDAISF